MSCYHWEETARAQPYITFKGFFSENQNASNEEAKLKELAICKFFSLILVGMF